MNIIHFLSVGMWVGIAVSVIGILTFLLTIHAGKNSVMPGSVISLFVGLPIIIIGVVIFLISLVIRII